MNRNSIQCIKLQVKERPHTEDMSFGRLAFEKCCSFFLSLWPHDSHEDLRMRPISPILVPLFCFGFLLRITTDGQ